MRSHGYGASAANGYSGNIVEEYWSPTPEVFTGDFQAFKALSVSEKQAVITKEAEEYGMEKPQGYNVSFHYNPHVEYHHFGSSHPMKPWRLTLTKQLIVAYGLEYTMDLYEPRPASFDELAVFHDRQYLNFLSHVTPQNAKPDDPAYIAFGFGGESNDCPVFDGLWNYVSLYGGASLHAAHNLTNKQSDIAINWSGGLHHAKKNVASGFCYVNDIVLAIQHLLTQNQRVLYIDIDVHHGDGVEQAFESTDRVFTLSYHKYGNDRHGYPFFPGTGNITETGPTDPSNRGKGHCLNIPLEDGIDDEQYKWLFKTVTDAVVQKYQPNAIVLQSGADSLGGDRLGRFNLNIKAHGFCIETVKGYQRPILVIGGGGYTPRNVARTWCHETSVCVGATLHDNLPSHIPYIQAFQGSENGDGILYPDLHNTKRHENVNTNQKLQNLVAKAMENLRYLEGAPSVVVNTRGLTEEMIMKIREEVERELEEEREDRHFLSVENKRRTRERNTGGRGERGLR
ncbi:histone deacetylase [Lojkania enalia]|uniref:Histone deacetylase n=1 Tax=Lojkania enalia TaxID=147567 RepID=A0A9P4K8J9_9PLEO|nr:histone deacetylase [Didymosphaeria enalia]